MLCVLLFHSLLFHYVLLPDMTHCIEFIIHKWASQCSRVWKVTVTSSLLDAKPMLFPMSNLGGENRYRSSHVLREQDYSGKISGRFYQSSGRKFCGCVFPGWVIQEERAHLACGRHPRRFFD